MYKETTVPIVFDSSNTPTRQTLKNKIMANERETVMEKIDNAPHNILNAYLYFTLYKC
jgi:ribosomal protein S24E